MARNPPPAGTRFQPGQSGNPGGRPKGSVSLTTLLRRALAEKATPKAAKTAAEAIVAALLKAARDGDQRAIQYVFDRIDGPAGKQAAETAPAAEDINTLRSHLERLKRPDDSGDR